MSITFITVGLCLTLTAGFGQDRMHEKSRHPHIASGKASRLTGTYTRIKHSRDENQSATLEVKQLGGSRIRIHLTALWWPVGREDSAHNGEIEATVPVRGRIAVYRNGDYRLSLRFGDRRVVLTESGISPDFGVNVTAAGTYQRTRRGRT